MSRMVFFDFLYRYSLWISPPFFALGVASLIYFIKNVIRLRVEKQILTVPLAAQQYIEFGEAGRVVLCIDGPFFTRRFARTNFELRTAAGTPLKGRSTLLSQEGSL